MIYANRVQLLNPKTKTWVKVDKETGRLWHKKDNTPWKNVPTIEEYDRLHKTHTEGALEALAQKSVP